jgi:hypothetical protein
VFADLTAKLVRAGDGDDFVAIGGQVALDSEHGWMLADVLPPMLHIDGSSTEASTMRYFLESLQLLVGKIGWSIPAAYFAMTSYSTGSSPWPGPVGHTARAGGSD